MAAIASALLHLTALALLMLWPEARKGEQRRQALTTIVFPTPKPSPAADPPRPATATAAAPTQDAATRGVLATPVPTLAAALPITRPSTTPDTEPASGDETHRGAGAAGLGQGAAGNGTGLGGGGPAIQSRPREGSPPIRTGGSIRNADYPRRASKVGHQGRVETEITVDKNGRPSACTITRSSGSAELDEATCRLITRRFRYTPARDRSGRAVEGVATYDQEWIFRRAGGE